jgi:hypothetical protein
MAIVQHALSQTDADIAETTQYASDHMQTEAAMVASATTTALAASGADKFTKLLQLEIEMQRVEATLVTLREFVSEMKHRAAP